MSTFIHVNHRMGCSSQYPCTHLPDIPISAGLLVPELHSRFSAFVGSLICHHRPQQQRGFTLNRIFVLFIGLDFTSRILSDETLQTPPACDWMREPACLPHRGYLSVCARARVHTASQVFKATTGNKKRIWIVAICYSLC